jgi:hypothetical protein
MKTRWALVAAMLAAGSGMGQENRAAFRIRLHYGPQASTAEIRHAESTAARILANAGVQMEWDGGRQRKSAPEETVEIQLDDSAPAPDTSAETLGYALLRRKNGVRIHIFLDRIREIDKAHTGLALGYVLAHEIGHVLEGVARHSETGVLKAHFDTVDITAIFKGTLQFSPADVALIQAHFSDHAHAD